MKTSLLSNQIDKYERTCQHQNFYKVFFKHYPIASEGIRDVANLTERKNLHTPTYGVKKFVCLSVCLSVRL